MQRRSSRLIALLCVLFLLGAQQLAYAHGIGHLSNPASAATTSKTGGDGDAPSHLCMTCAACAALSAAPPPFVAPCDAVHVAAILVPEVASAYLPGHFASIYSARAPPAPL